MILSLLGGLAAVNVVGLDVLRRGEVFVRFVPVADELFDQLGRDRPLRALPDTSFFRTRVDRLETRVPGPGHEEVLALLGWTMNQVEAVEEAPRGMSAREAFELASRGSGLLCGPMSNMFQHILATQGYTTRHVQLARSLFNRTDIHVTTEVLINGRWVVYDPTFHVSFARNGQLLGAAEIRDALRSGTHEEVEPVFHGEVRYPARLDEYYMHWLPLYNNVLVMEDHRALWARLPPLRYWVGPRYYYIENTERPLWHVSAVDRFYMIFVAVLPLACLGLALLFLAVTLRWASARSGASGSVS